MKSNHKKSIIDDEMYTILKTIGKTANGKQMQIRKTISYSREQNFAHYIFGKKKKKKNFILMQ